MPKVFGIKPVDIVVICRTKHICRVHDFKELDMKADKKPDQTTRNESQLVCSNENVCCNYADNYYGDQKCIQVKSSFFATDRQSKN